MEPTTEDCALIAEEERILARAKDVIASAARRAERKREEERRSEHAGDLRSAAALHALRDEAAHASEDDLPSLLHELDVRQRLRARAEDAPLPDVEAPYFAHLRVREDGPSGRPVAKDYLLGRATCIDAAAGVRIVDWRVAPVARIFYRHREGDAYEESFPGRDVEGIVDARRIVVVERGVVTRIVTDTVVLARDETGAWRRLGRSEHTLDPGGAGAAVRAAADGTNVTALLDADQFAAVSSPVDRPLLVLGSAGSGKTTVALHRLARIVASERATRPIERSEVVVPEEGLARLSRRLLAPLGAGASQVRTLDAWSYATARAVFGEPFPRVWYDAPGVVTSLKRHPRTFDAIRERLVGRAGSTRSLRTLRRRLADVFTDRTFLGSIVDASRGDLPRTAVEETVRHTMLQLAEPVTRELAFITDSARKRAVDGRRIDEGTPDELAGTVDVEELPILLFLHASVVAPRRSVAHLVVDEAEDFSLFELSVLGRLLEAPPSVTLAGDEAQQTHSSFAGWERATSALGAADPATCRLEVSYRCPRPVIEIAQAILGPLARSRGAARPPRDGAPVGLFTFPEEAHVHLFLASALKDLVEREPRASIGVLARDEDAARRFAEATADLPRARHVVGGEFSFEPGIDVADVDAAKGLEFDYVVVPDATAGAYPATDDARRRLHVAATRASHQLWLVAAAAPTPLVPALASSGQVSSRGRAGRVRAS